MRSPAVVIVAAFSLSACAVAWRNTYNIESATPSAVTIAYDASLTSSHAIVGVANQSCSQFDKVAVPKSQTRSGWGIERIFFVCDTPGEAALEPRAQLRDMVVTFNPAQVPPAPIPSFAPVESRMPRTPPPLPVGTYEPSVPKPSVPNQCIGVVTVPTGATGTNPCPQP